MVQKIDLDLDAIKGKSKWVKLKGKAIEVPPITLDDLYELEIILSEFQSLDETTLEPKEAIGALREFHEQIAGLIPDLQGVKCSLEDLMAIVELAFDSAAPKDQAELKKRGITPRDHQKKVTRTTRS